MLYSTVALVALAGSSLVSAAPILHARKEAPTGWAHTLLEDYYGYHVRYLALDCPKQHNTTFFDECCRPLKANQTLEDRETYCTPNSTALESASARVAAKAAAAKTATTSLSPQAAVSDNAASEWVQVATEAAQSASTTITTPDWYAVETSTYQTKKNKASKTPAAEPSPIEQVKTAEPPVVTPESKPSTTKKNKPTTTDNTSEPEPTQQSNNNSGNNGNSGNSGNGKTYSGQGTWYRQHEGADPSGLGSCGYRNSDSDYIAAISTTGGSSWGNTQCGKSITVKNKANGKTVSVEIVDNCPSCRDANSLDLSVPAFTQIAAYDTGEIEIEWWFN